MILSQVMYILENSVHWKEDDKKFITFPPQTITPKLHKIDQMCIVYSLWSATMRSVGHIDPYIFVSVKWRW